MLTPNNILLILLVSSTVFFYGCPSQEHNEEGTNEEAPIENGDVEAAGDEETGGDKLELELVDEKDGIKLYKKTSSYEYPAATLVMKQPLSNTPVSSPVDFVFDVAHFELGQQTPDAASLGLANSDKGQHIHLILNNDPYSAHYEPVFKKELEPGHYVALAFLSRSYHESVKESNSAVVKQFTVGEAAEEGIDLLTGHMFYSRPKGTYVGDATKQVLLDFYLHELDLGDTGNFVRATINGASFDLTEWAPYIIEGMPMGENTIKLELMERGGLLIDSPFNYAERTITLKPAE